MINRYPLTWPADKARTPAEKRERASFAKIVQNTGYKNSVRLSVVDAVARITKELDSYTRTGHAYRVPPETVIISSNLATGKKGLPLSSLPEPKDPGVAVYFTLDGYAYCLPCDKWDRVADNLAAVAAHIGAMRGIERWGVGSSHDVYTGFKAIPQHAGSSNGAWWLILEVEQNASPAEIKQAHRRLSAKYHPDTRVTGDKDAFIRVQMAYQEAIAGGSHD